jgi:hypothetical protein
MPFKAGDPRTKELARKGGHAKNKTPPAQVLRAVGDILREMSNEEIADSRGNKATRNEAAAYSIFNNALKDARWMELYLKLTEQMPSEKIDANVTTSEFTDALQREIAVIKRREGYAAHGESDAKTGS